MPCNQEIILRSCHLEHFPFREYGSLWASDIQASGIIKASGAGLHVAFSSFTASDFLVSDNQQKWMRAERRTPVCFVDYIVQPLRAKVCANLAPVGPVLDGATMKLILEALCSMQFLFSPGRFLNGMSGRLECTERGVLKNVNEMWSASSSPWFLGRQGEYTVDGQNPA